MTKNIIYKPLATSDFDALVTLANHVHGDGYLSLESLQSWYQKGLFETNKEIINASFVAYDSTKLIGFRITYAPQQWCVDQWSTPTLWKVAVEKVCYFKCNTVDEAYRGLGVGSQMLSLSIAAAKKQGAQAGVSHLWKQSPGNSAVKYFTKCGGELIKSHPGKWNEESKKGYNCIFCGFDCRCEAAEMIIYF
jgi:ribosomal protein S18 acetylase RimI-like enzyme